MRETLPQYREKMKRKERYQLMAYNAAVPFLRKLHRCFRHLPYDQITMIRELALSGDLEGAEKALHVALGKIDCTKLPTVYKYDKGGRAV